MATSDRLITFKCPTCGQPFSVPMAYVGRKAKCKGCGGPVVVPMPPDPEGTPGAVFDPDSASMPVRTRRLIADARQIAEMFKDFPLVSVKAMIGDPPELYQIEYRVNGLQRGWMNKPKPRDTHEVEIQLTSDYPRMAPKCRMLTPIFHPNIDETTICVGDHWTAGERLADLIIRIGEMIAYQAYNIRSPLDGEAAMWADLNQGKFPIDARSLIPSD